MAASSGAVGVGVAARLGPAARPVGQQARRSARLDGEKLGLAVELGQPLALHGARRRDAGRDIGRAFGRRRQGEVGGARPAARRCRDRCGRAAVPRACPGSRRRSAGARPQARLGSIRWPQRQGFIAATSWKRAGIGDMGVGAGHGHAAALQRLAQRLQRGAMELRQLVEEQHAVMGERHLARPGARAAADQRLQGRRMMRIAEACGAGRACRRRVSPASERTMVASSASSGFERRQHAGQARRQHRLARAGRADHQPCGTMDPSVQVGDQLGAGGKRWRHGRRHTPTRGFPHQSSPKAIAPDASSQRLRTMHAGTIST